MRTAWWHFGLAVRWERFGDTLSLSMVRTAWWHFVLGVRLQRSGDTLSLEYDENGLVILCPCREDSLATLYPLSTDTTVWWHFVLEVWRWRFDDNFVLGVQGKRFCDTLSLENGQNSSVALFLEFLANDFVVFRPYIDSFCPMPIAKCFEWLFYSVISTLHNVFNILCQHMLFRPQSCGIYHCFKRLSPVARYFTLQKARNLHKVPLALFLLQTSVVSDVLPEAVVASWKWVLGEK